MYYRKAGIAQYTRHLVRAMASRLAQPPLPRSPALTVLLDRRDTDTAWLPPNIGIIRSVTPAHHRYEHLALPIELAARRIGVLHSPDFITVRGHFRKVITVHDLYFMEHPEVMDAAGARYYGRIGWSIRAADRVIAVSHFTRDEILRLLPDTPPHKITVIHEAPTIADSRFTIYDSTHAAPTQQSAIENRQSKIGPYALFVGTFEPRKNLTTLLTALAAWRDRPGDFRLVIVGERGWAGGDPARLAADLGLSDLIHFAGRASDPELEEWYRGARVLVFPSLSEGFGLPVLDAMARGVPVVCSSAGALAEVAGDAALLHDPLDAGALSNLMRQMWHDDALRARHIQLGLSRARQFTWDRAARETSPVFETREV